jgi:purine nucleosidase
MKRVIFDTDIGIDDAMALLFLHYAPEVQLEAITTVSGNASIANTTRNACYVCERFAIDVPVFRGAASPVGAALGSEPPAFVHGSNGLGDISFEPPKKRVEATPAAEAIVKLAEAAPGELSVVAVGRLTNLARALDLCPRLPSLLKDVVVMGGVIGHRGCRGNVTPVAEANIAGDPIAADRVFGSGLALTLVGLDVTQETIMNEDFIDTLRATAGDAGEFIHDITRFYFDFYESLGAGAAARFTTPAPSPALSHRNCTRPSQVPCGLPVRVSPWARQSSANTRSATCSATGAIGRLARSASMSTPRLCESFTSTPLRMPPDWPARLASWRATTGAG